MIYRGYDMYKSPLHRKWIACLVGKPYVSFYGPTRRSVQEQIDTYLSVKSIFTN